MRRKLVRKSRIMRTCSCRCRCCIRMGVATHICSTLSTTFRDRFIIFSTLGTFHLRCNQSSQYNWTILSNILSPLMYENSGFVSAAIPYPVPVEVEQVEVEVEVPTKSKIGLAWLSSGSSTPLPHPPSQPSSQENHLGGCTVHQLAMTRLHTSCISYCVAPVYTRPWRYTRPHPA